MGSHSSDGEPAPLRLLTSARVAVKITEAQRCDILIGGIHQRGMAARPLPGASVGAVTWRMKG